MAAKKIMKNRVKAAELCMGRSTPEKQCPGLRCGRGTEDKRRETQIFPREMLCAL